MTFPNDETELWAKEHVRAKPSTNPSNNPLLTCLCYYGLLSNRLTRSEEWDNDSPRGVERDLYTL